jgi:hypothetical protein
LGNSSVLRDFSFKVLSSIHIWKDAIRELYHSGTVSDVRLWKYLFGIVKAALPLQS